MIPNSTQVPNKIFDEIMPKLSDTALRILLVIARQTYGWIEDKKTNKRKEKDWISYSQLKEKTGRQNEAITNAIRELENEEIIEILDGSGNKILLKDRRGRSLFYRINTSPKSGEPIPNLTENRNSEIGDTKETYTKERKSNKNYSKEKIVEVKQVKQKNKSPSMTSLSPCSYEELWKIAVELRIPLNAVQQKHKEILELIESGEMQRKYKKDTTTYYTLRNWLRMSKKGGYLEELDEVGMMDLMLYSPQKMEELRIAKEILEKLGRL